MIGVRIILLFWYAFAVVTPFRTPFSLPAFSFTVPVSGIVVLRKAARRARGVSESPRKRADTVQLSN